MKILGIESSCDETAVSVVEDGRKELSNVVASQIDIHREYGGVVPEIASRNHIKVLSYLIDKALEDADTTLEEIDAIAVTYGPGLIGSLLVGLSEAKAIAFASEKPLIGVNHIEGHIAANYLTYPELEPPFLCLVVSGGHTYLIRVNDYNDFIILGRTLDDAAGEAFDKISRVLELGYPGGPAIDKAAKEGDASIVSFPRANLGPDSLDFSFSGLKSAVINYLNQKKQKSETFNPVDIAASFQEAVIDVLVKNTFKAIERENLDKIVVGGGVSANSALREALSEEAENRGITLYLPELKYTGDNAAMIAAQAYYNYLDGKTHDYDLDAVPNLNI